jgi:hypothetical protein
MNSKPTVKHLFRNAIAGAAALALLGAASARGATTKFSATKGSKIRIEGTSNIHDWQVEGTLIGGFIEVGGDFPVEPGKAVTPGKVDVKGEAFVTVRSLRSIKKDGTPYDDKMDEVMYEKFKEKELANKKVVYRLKELTLKEAAKSKDLPYVFESKGEMVAAGVTNQVSMPINVLPLGANRLKITAMTTVKMTDFKIEPPAPAIALGMIKTGDEVKLFIEWIVENRAARAADAGAAAPAAK